MARPWRGLRALVHDAVDATTELVREGQGSARRAVQRMTEPIAPLAGPSRMIDGAIGLHATVTLGAVKAVNRVVEALTDVAIGSSQPVDDASSAPVPLRSDVVGTAAWVEDAALGVLNGAIGHHLAATGNGLDLGLRLRIGDRYLAPDAPAPGPAWVVLVHGLGTTEWCWSLDATNFHGDPTASFATMLARDTGATPLLVRYNTGRTVAENGRALAEALERAAVDVQRIGVVGHSMGGLVARAACAAAARDGHSWLGRVHTVISLGTPHQGAPLARFGEATAAGLGAIDLPATRVLSRILAARSAGIRDLEHGDVGAPEDIDDRLVPLIDGIRYAFLSATVTSNPDDTVSAWLGDLLVQVGSASRPLRHETFPILTHTTGGVLHHQLLSHPAVYAQILPLLAPS